MEIIRIAKFRNASSRKFESNFLFNLQISVGLASSNGKYYQENSYYIYIYQVYLHVVFMKKGI